MNLDFTINGCVAANSRSSRLPVLVELMSAIDGPSRAHGAAKARWKTVPPEATALDRPCIGWLTAVRPANQTGRASLGPLHGRSMENTPSGASKFFAILFPISLMWMSSLFHARSKTCLEIITPPGSVRSSNLWAMFTTSPKMSVPFLSTSPTCIPMRTIILSLCAAVTIRSRILRVPQSLWLVPATGQRTTRSPRMICLTGADWCH